MCLRPHRLRLRETQLHEKERRKGLGAAPELGVDGCRELEVVDVLQLIAIRILTVVRRSEELRRVEHPLQDDGPGFGAMASEGEAGRQNEEDAESVSHESTEASTRCLTNRASAAGARFAGAPRARSFYATRQAHKRNSSLLGRARQLQALVRRQPFKDVGTDSALL